MAEFEFAGMTFKGGKMAVILTALSTLGGASWATFEFYKDYMDMKEIVQNIDVDAIAARNAVMETKLDDAIEYTRDIKSGLRDDILWMVDPTSAIIGGQTPLLKYPPLWYLARRTPFPRARVIQA